MILPRHGGEVRGGPGPAGSGVGRGAGVAKPARLPTRRPATRCTAPRRKGGRAAAGRGAAPPA